MLLMEHPLLRILLTTSASDLTISSRGLPLFLPLPQESALARRIRWSMLLLIVFCVLFVKLINFSADGAAVGFLFAFDGGLVFHAHVFAVDFVLAIVFAVAGFYSGGHVFYIWGFILKVLR